MRKTDKPIISSCQMVGECKFPADNNPPPAYSTQHTTQQVMSERIHQSKNNILQQVTLYSIRDKGIM